MSEGVKKTSSMEYMACMSGHVRRAQVVFISNQATIVKEVYNGRIDVGFVRTGGSMCMIYTCMCVCMCVYIYIYIYVYTS
jgi:hypothetical protein